MSKQRYCFIYKATNSKWYMELAQKEYGERDDATTYGPFDSEESTSQFLDGFSNPGGYTLSESGKEPVPVVSPNGYPLVIPKLPQRHSFLDLR